jgi:hypothetical protein
MPTAAAAMHQKPLAQSTSMWQILPAAATTMHQKPLAPVSENPVCGKLLPLLPLLHATKPTCPVHGESPCVQHDNLT